MKLSMWTLLAFATLASAAPPNGWIVAGSAPKDYDYGTETESTGSKSAYIKSRDTAKSTGFGTLMQMVNADSYRGGRWKLSARMRTNDAAKAQMWMRVDGPDNAMNAFDNMDDRPVTGDTGWKTYEIVLDVPQDSVGVAFGFFLSGGGEVWADDFKLERVPDTTPLTGKRDPRPRAPANLNFEN